MRELPVAREGALFLAGDVDLAWRLYTLALLAEELARVTPAVEAAKRAGIEFRLHEYEGVEVGDGDYAVGGGGGARTRPPAQLFKTLVASVDGELAVFVVPADQQLDLRAAGKRASSPTGRRPSARRATSSAGSARSGQRKRLPTTIDASVLEWETILVSAGAAGCRSSSRPPT